jgi:hypothetical protein
MAISSFSIYETLPAILECLLKRTLRYRHQTRTRNPVHKSVACASTYFIMVIQIGKAGSCQHKKPRQKAPLFGFHFLCMDLKIKLFYKHCSFSVFYTRILLLFPFHQHITIPPHSLFLHQLHSSYFLGFPQHSMKNILGYKFSLCSKCFMLSSG